MHFWSSSRFAVAVAWNWPALPGFINAEYGVRSAVDPTAMRNARNQPKTNVRCIQKLTSNGLFSLCAKVDKLPHFFFLFFFLPSLAAFHLLDWKMQSTWGEYFSGKWYKGYGMLLLVVLRLHSSIQCDCQRKRNNKTTWKQFCWQNTASLLKYNKERNNTIFQETKVSGTWKLSIKNVWIMCYCFPREEQ